MVQFHCELPSQRFAIPRNHLRRTPAGSFCRRVVLHSPPGLVVKCQLSLGQSLSAVKNCMTVTGLSTVITEDFPDSEDSRRVSVFLLAVDPLPHSVSSFSTVRSVAPLPHKYAPCVLEGGRPCDRLAVFLLGDGVKRIEPSFEKHYRLSGVPASCLQAYEYFIYHGAHVVDIQLGMNDDEAKRHALRRFLALPGNNKLVFACCHGRKADGALTLGSKRRHLQWIDFEQELLAMRFQGTLTIVLDSCYSGRWTQALDERWGGPPGRVADLHTELPGLWINVVCSSRYNEQSWDQLFGGCFANAILSALSRERPSQQESGIGFGTRRLCSGTIDHRGSLHRGTQHPTSVCFRFGSFRQRLSGGKPVSVSVDPAMRHRDPAFLCRIRVQRPEGTKRGAHRVVLLNGTPLELHVFGPKHPRTSNGAPIAVGVKGPPGLRLRYQIVVDGVSFAVTECTCSSRSMHLTSCTALREVWQLAAPEADAQNAARTMAMEVEIRVIWARYILAPLPRLNSSA